MEFIEENKILEFPSGTLEAVRKVYGLEKPGAMKESVDILEEWVKKQNHFKKKDFDRRYLETTIILSKGSIERAKERLDKGCTLRTLMPQFYGDYDVKNDFKDFNGVIHHAVLPKYTEDYYRVFVLKNIGTTFTSSLIIDYYRWTIPVLEYLRVHDYPVGYIGIFDYSNVNIMDLATKMNIMDLRQAMTLVLEGYGVRIKQIHIISPLKVIELIVGIFKQVLSAKVGDRIIVHRSVEGLHDYIPKEVLPVNYGGQERSVETLHDEWMDVVSSKPHRMYIREMNSACTDETLRQKDQFNEQYMGMPGSFRSLSVD